MLILKLAILETTTSVEEFIIRFCELTHRNNLYVLPILRYHIILNLYSCYNIHHIYYRLSKRLKPFILSTSVYIFFSFYQKSQKYT